MSFCAGAWQHTERLQRAILEHPFNAALADGTLDRDTFAFYLVQDARYLIGFSRALAVASARAARPDEAAFFAQSAHTALVVERGLHADYLAGDSVDHIETTPSSAAYLSFLHSTALVGSYPELVAAVLPCFWVYEHVGTTIHSRVADLDAHPYAAWISTYADPTFAESVATARSIADRVAVDEMTGQAMLDVFVRGCEYEWMFWDAAWRQEGWPTRSWVAPPSSQPIATP